MFRTTNLLTHKVRTKVLKALNTDLGEAEILLVPCQCRYHVVLGWMTADMLGEHLRFKF